MFFRNQADPATRVVRTAHGVDVHYALIFAVVILPAVLDDNEAYQQGVTLYQNLEFEQAVFRFEEAALSADLTDQERAQVFLWMAMSYAGLGKEEAAKRSIRDALRRDLNPDVPAFAPPKITEWLNEIREQVKQEKAAAPEEDPAAEPPPPTSEVEIMEVKPEDPAAPAAAADDDGGPSVLSLVLIGGGVGGMLLGAAIAGAGGIFWFDFWSIQTSRIPEAPSSTVRARYQQAALYDAIIGSGLAAVGLFIVAAGAGTVGYGAFVE